MKLTLTIGIEKDPSYTHAKIVCRFTSHFFFKSSFSIEEIQNIFNHLSTSIIECKPSLEKYGFADCHFVMNPNKRNQSDKDVWHDGDNLIFLADRPCSIIELEKATDFFKKYPTATHYPLLGITATNFNESDLS